MIRLTLVSIAVITGISALIWWALDHDAKVEARWKAKCVESGLPPQQCEVLWSVKSSSNAAAGLAAGAIGVAIGAAGVRR